MSNLARAIEIAASAHVMQKRYDGSPYILHPLRLMFKLDGEHEQICAVLHDLVEDTDWSFEDLSREGFDEAILEALRLLTHSDREEYEDYIEKIYSNPIATKVKIADLEDNMNLLELPSVSERDLKRSEKYHRSWLRLNR